jgi:SAM-dependent methyltransferase
MKTLAPQVHRCQGASPEGEQYDFAWSRTAYRGPWIASAVFLTFAVALQLEFASLWPAWFAVALIGINFAIGAVYLRSTDRADTASLPLVDLIRADDELVLDAGCGAGRTTLALSKVLRQGRVVAFDRFDAPYIDGGGRAALERNLRIAGLAARVAIEKGDLSALPFPEAHFDTAVSAHVIDHMGRHKEAGLAGIHRVLKPGGRFLMVVWVPGWVTFSLASFFCLLLTTKVAWRSLAQRVGFVLRDEGMFNGMWFAVLEKPR